uniref:Uncharacterized protein n=1 Tax=Rhizophora mucronata TaxID=61149 RepID=A0A2P2P3Z0_RHIMU
MKQSLAEHINNINSTEYSKSTYCAIMPPLGPSLRNKQPSESTLSLECLMVTLNPSLELTTTDFH